MKITINDLINIGIITEQTSKRLTKNGTRKFIINNPFEPNKTSIYYLYNNENKDISNYVVKGKYIVRKKSKLSHNYYCPWSWTGSDVGTMVVKTFDSFDETMDYLVKKFIHYYFTQTSDGYTNYKYLLSKSRMKKMDNLTIKTIQRQMSVARLLKDPELSIKTYLKTMD